MHRYLYGATENARPDIARLDNAVPDKKQCCHCPLAVRIDCCLYCMLQIKQWC